MTEAKVEARLLRGLRDLLPEQMLARQRIVQTVREVYEIYGFVPIETPAIEMLDVLSGSAGEEAQRSIFKVTGPEFDELGLRFDLTVPLARVIAQYPHLPRPFRRYQVSSVWRADKPGPGRFREFVQFDLDSVGVPTEIADTEIIAGMCDTLSAIGVGAYRVRFSSRRVLNLLLSFADLPAASSAEVFRVLDKLEKSGIEKVRLELTSGYKDESGADIGGLGLAVGQVERVERFLAIRSDSRNDVLDQLSETLASVPESAAEIAVLRRISNHLEALGYANDRAVIDLSIARGLAYYTGPVFEATLLDAPEFGSVFGGGRYDDLVLRFLGERVPATGASIGIDRLLTALSHLGRLGTGKATAQVLVADLDPSLTGECLAITYGLRRAGIPTEFYLGEDRSIGRQLKYADQWEIPIVLLYGPDEHRRTVVTLKDMVAGRRASGAIAEREAWRRERPGQWEVSRDGVVEAVRGALAEEGEPIE